MRTPIGVVSYLSVGGASVEDLTADWLEKTVDGNSDRRSEVARDAAGRSLEQEQKMQGTPSPQPKSHFLFNPPSSIPHTHTCIPSAKRKVFRQEDSIHIQQSSRQRVGGYACVR